MSSGATFQNEVFSYPASSELWTSWDSSDSLKDSATTWEDFSVGQGDSVADKIPSDDIRLVCQRQCVGNCQCDPKSRTVEISEELYSAIVSLCGPMELPDGQQDSMASGFTECSSFAPSASVGIQEPGPVSQGYYETAQPSMPFPYRAMPTSPFTFVAPSHSSPCFTIPQAIPRLTASLPPRSWPYPDARPYKNDVPHIIPQTYVGTPAPVTRAASQPFVAPRDYIETHGFVAPHPSSGIFNANRSSSNTSENFSTSTQEVYSSTKNVPVVAVASPTYHEYTHNPPLNDTCAYYIPNIREHPIDTNFYNQRDTMSDTNSISEYDSVSASSQGSEFRSICPPDNQAPVGGFSEDEIAMICQAFVKQTAEASFIQNTPIPDSPNPASSSTTELRASKKPRPANRAPAKSKRPGSGCPMLRNQFISRGRLELIPINVGMLYTCQWAGCQARIYGTRSAILGHLRQAHGVPNTRGNSKDRVICHWPDCGRSFSVGSLSKHVGCLHFKSLAYQCQWCHSNYSRRDALVRHLQANFREEEESSGVDGERPKRRRRCSANELWSDISNLKT